MALEKLKYLLLPLLFLMAFPAWSTTITDIQIQGLKRTKPAVLLEKLEKFKSIVAAIPAKTISREKQKEQSR